MTTRAYEAEHVACGVCGSGIGQPCYSSAGKQLTRPHTARRERSFQQAQRAWFAVPTGRHHPEPEAGIRADLGYALADYGPSYRRPVVIPDGCPRCEGAVQVRDGERVCFICGWEGD